MKKIIVNTFGLITLALISYSFSGGYTSGATGSPGDSGASCGNSGCHNFTPITSQSLITTDIPSSGFMADSTYNITVSVAHANSSKFGFQVTAESSQGQKMGTFNAGSNTEVQVGSSSTLATHTSNGTSGAGSKSWTVEWTAPSSLSENVMFYAIVNAADGNNSKTNDTLYTHSITVAIDSSSLGTGISFIGENTNLTIYPNPVTESFFVRYNSNKLFNLELYDINARLVKTFSNISVNEEIDVRSIEKGTYIVVTKFDENSFVEKIIIK